MPEIDPERLALAMEEAALRVRQHPPARVVAFEQEDYVDRIDVGGGFLPGMRTPVLRHFRLEWDA